MIFPLYYTLILYKATHLKLDKIIKFNLMIKIVNKVNQPLNSAEQLKKVKKTTKPRLLLKKTTKIPLLPKKKTKIRLLLKR